MKQASFTLIELLVVISIIAILASIALPVFTRVMEKSRATQDANSLRQLGISMVGYLNDNDDQMFSVAVTAGGSGWPATMQARYLPSWKSFQSPFDKRTPSELTATAPVSYGLNPNVMAPDASKTTTGTGWAGNMGSVKSSTSTIMMAPNFDATKDPSDISAWKAKGSENPSLTVPTTAARGKGTHSSRNQINVLFCDSHVETIKSIDYTDSKSVNVGDKRWDPTK